MINHTHVGQHVKSLPGIHPWAKGKLLSIDNFGQAILECTQTRINAHGRPIPVGSYKCTFPAAELELESDVIARAQAQAKDNSIP